VSGYYGGGPGLRASRRPRAAPWSLRSRAARAPAAARCKVALVSAHAHHGAGAWAKAAPRAGRGAAIISLNSRRSASSSGGGAGAGAGAGARDDERDAPVRGVGKQLSKLGESALGEQDGRLLCKRQRGEAWLCLSERGKRGNRRGAGAESPRLVKSISKTSLGERLVKSKISKEGRVSSLLERGGRLQSHS